MAVPTNTQQTYAMNRIREDLSGIIYQTGKAETPLLSALARGRATATLHEWLRVPIPSGVDNAQVEGDDAAADPPVATVRLSNHTQIMRRVVAVSGTSEATDKAGRKSEMAMQLFLAGKGLKHDIERALFQNGAKAAGSSTTPRRMAGLLSWVSSNTNAGTGGVDPIGDGTDTRTDGTVRTLTQAMFDNVMSKIAAKSSRTGRKTVFCHPLTLSAITSFTGANNQRFVVQGRESRVVNAVDIYVTQWGEVVFESSINCRQRDLWILDTSMWAWATLPGRDMRVVPLAKTGDSDKRMLIVEGTLEARNEESSGGVFDIQ